MSPSLPTEMNAVTQDRYGTPEVLTVRRIAVPRPVEGQVLVRVHGASMNMYDWHMTTGTPRIARMMAGLRRPKNAVPGSDVAGVVVAVGPGVTRLSIGDEVMGMIGWGSWAEYAVASEKALAVKPASVTFEEAASLPLAGLTALQGLRDCGGVTAGHRVVVNGASGGVGTFAVMIGVALGAEVTAVCSTGKVEMVRGLGAVRVVDYTTQDYTETLRGQQVLFDNVGNRGWRTTSRVLAPGGVTAMVTGPKHPLLGPVREVVGRRVMSIGSGKRHVQVAARGSVDDLTTLAGMLADGSIRPVVERVVPLADVPATLSYLGEGHARGKLVVTP